MAKPLLLLAALTICCCIATMHASPKIGCHCIRYHPAPIRGIRTIKEVKMFPISGHCRRAELIITWKNGSKTCFKPGQKWVEDMINKLTKGCGKGKARPCVHHQLF